MGPSWVKSPPCTIKLGWIRWKVHFRYPSPWTQGSLVLLPVSLTLNTRQLSTTSGIPHPEHKAALYYFRYQSPYTRQVRKTSCIPHPVNKTAYYYFRYIHQTAHRAASYYFRYPSKCTLQYTDLYFLRFRLHCSKDHFSHLGNPQPMQ